MFGMYSNLDFSSAVQILHSNVMKAACEKGLDIVQAQELADIVVNIQELKRFESLVSPKLLSEILKLAFQDK